MSLNKTKITTKPLFYYFCVFTFLTVVPMVWKKRL